jgi:glycosyltransferase involved in cell wall biosynthesis
MPTLALCYLNYGPYHRARLAAGRESIHDYEVVGLQATAHQTEYLWDQCAADNILSLEQDRLPEEVPPTDWREHVPRVLGKLRPACCAIAGYSHPSMLALIEWCIRNRCPIVLISDSTAADAPRSKWKEWLKGQIVKKCSAGFVAGTPHAEYLSQLGMPADCLFLGCDAVDNAHFARTAAKARAQPAAARAQLGLPDAYFIASARFLEKKNLFRLLEAYAIYRARSAGDPTALGDPWGLVVLGDGPLRPQLEKLRESLGLTAHVQLTGFQQYDELPKFYGLAKALVHASTVEQWGLVANEAMAAGRPVLMSNRCGCATHLAQDCVNGFTFDPCDVAAIADRMIRLAKLSPQQLKQFGAESERIIADWGLERFARGLRMAADRAIEVGPKTAGMKDRLIIQTVLRR